jgi:hypothetical protein
MRLFIFLVSTSMFYSLITQIEANSLLKTIYDLKDISDILNSIPYKLGIVSNGIDKYLPKKWEYKPHKYDYAAVTTTTTTISTTTTEGIECKYI